MPYKKGWAKRSTFTIGDQIMKVGFVLVVFSSVAFAQNCPKLPPIQCGPNEMTCGGGIDAAGCPLPNTCLVNEGKFSKESYQFQTVICSVAQQL